MLRLKHREASRTPGARAPRAADGAEPAPRAAPPADTRRRPPPPQTRGWDAPPPARPFPSLSSPRKKEPRRTSGPRRRPRGEGEGAAGKPQRAEAEAEPSGRRHLPGRRRGWGGAGPAGPVPGPPAGVNPPRSDRCGAGRAPLPPVPTGRRGGPAREAQRSCVLSPPPNIKSFGRK